MRRAAALLAAAAARPAVGGGAAGVATAWAPAVSASTSTAPAWARLLHSRGGGGRPAAGPDPAAGSPSSSSPAPRSNRPFRWSGGANPAEAQAAADAALAALRADAATTPLPRRPRVFYANAWGAARDLIKAAVRVPEAGAEASSADDRRAAIRAARAAAARLARAASAAFDAAGLTHTPASLTLAVSALAWACLPDDAAALVRQACADAGGAGTGLPRPLGAGAAPRPAAAAAAGSTTTTTTTTAPLATQAAIASAASALARSGRMDDAAALIEEVHGGGARPGGGGGGVALDEEGWARVVRFGGRSPGGVGARPARELLAAAAAAGVTPGSRCHTALVRAELDAGSLPNALAAVDEAAAAGVAVHASAWTALASRAAAHFGKPGRAAVEARADSIAVDVRAPPPPAWVDLAAAAASLPPGRVPARGLVGGKVREMAYASSGED